MPTDLSFPHLNDKVQIQRAMLWGPMVIIFVMMMILAGLVALLFGLLNSF